MADRAKNVGSCCLVLFVWFPFLLLEEKISYLRIKRLMPEEKGLGSKFEWAALLESSKSSSWPKSSNSSTCLTWNGERGTYLVQFVQKILFRLSDPKGACKSRLDRLFLENASWYPSGPRYLRGLSLAKRRKSALLDSFKSLGADQRSRDEIFSDFDPRASKWFWNKIGTNRGVGEP